MPRPRRLANNTLLSTLSGGRALDDLMFGGHPDHSRLTLQGSAQFEVARLSAMLYDKLLSGLSLPLLTAGSLPMDLGGFNMSLAGIGGGAKPADASALTATNAMAALSSGATLGPGRNKRTLVSRTGCAVTCTASSYAVAHRPCGSARSALAVPPQPPWALSPRPQQPPPSCCRCCC